MVGSLPARPALARTAPGARDLAAFATLGAGYATLMAANAENNETTKPGPANPQGSADLDAPTPPGGPMRSDAPSGGNAPGGPATPAQPGEAHEQQRPMRDVEEPRGPERSSAVPSSEAEQAQSEPSDNSGNEPGGPSDNSGQE